jgi:hypothetical protein
MIDHNSPDITPNIQDGFDAVEAEAYFARESGDAAAGDPALDFPEPHALECHDDLDTAEARFQALKDDGYQALAIRLEGPFGFVIYSGDR